MTTYAGVKRGWVAQTFTPLPGWERIPVEQLFASGWMDEWVRIDGLNPQPAYGWRYDNGTFTPPNLPDDAAAMRAALEAA